jgi:hypothetical protein
MGKRELIIAAAFVVIAAVAYQVTAPPPKSGERGFSLKNVFSGLKREMQSNSATATVEKAGTLAVRAGVTELRLTTSRSVPVTVVGEHRDDIAWEASVESTGPDEASAKDYANRTTIQDDDLGTAQRLDLNFPKEGQQTARFTLKVPARLLIRVEGSGRANVSGVRAVDLRNLLGEVTIKDIKELVSGSHRSGDLSITHAGAITLTLSSSRARLNEIMGPINLTGRNGDCTIAGSHGAVEATTNNVELTITDHEGAIRVSGEAGRLRVALPTKELAVDARRMVVEVTLAAAIPATIVTSDEVIRLTLVGPPGLTIDALNTAGGTIRAADFGLEPIVRERESKLAAPIGGGGSRVVLRNGNAEIVIGLRK